MTGNRTTESVLKDLDEQHQKYKFMELNLLQKKKKYVLTVWLIVLAITVKGVTIVNLNLYDCVKCILLSKYRN